MTARLKRAVGVLLLCSAAPVLAQSSPILRRPDAGPIGAINRGTVPDLVEMRINNGTFPRYSTGGNIDVRSDAIREAGPKARLQLRFLLDDQRLTIEPQAQIDGRLIAHVPADFFARAQAVVTTVIVGDRMLVNRTGTFVPEIAPVPDKLVDEGLKIICDVMCLTWPISRGVSPHWVSRTELYDSVEHRADIDEPVGGKWAVGQTTYLVTSRRLKDQFRFTAIDIASPSIAGGCPSNANENVWLYPARPLPLPQPPFVMKQLEVYARSNVTHCRLRGRNNLDANHFVFTRLRVRIEVEGPRGVSPWE